MSFTHSIELGAGSGIVSLAIALHLRSSEITNRIFITDGLDVLIPLIRYNTSLNNSHILDKTSVQAARLSWGEDLPDCIPSKPDVIFAADCCYLEESFPLLLKTLKGLIGEESVCYFCYKKRRRADREMIRLLKKVFTVVEVQGKWQREAMFIYEIRRR